MWALLLLPLLLVLCSVRAVAAASGYTNDFDRVQAGPLSDELGFLVLSGEFALRQEEGNGWLELAGTPLETFGLLFGPTFSPKSDPGVSVRAHFNGSARGRRYPVFGLGICGVGGFRLLVTPAKHKLELAKGDAVVASHDFDWKSGTWVALRLELIRIQGAWRIRGKAWDRSQAEPEDWQITYSPEDPPFSGRSSLWGIPYSGQPIQFDNIAVRTSESGP